MPFPTTLVDSYPDTDLIHYHENHHQWIPLLSPMLDIPEPEWDDAFKDAARAEAERSGKNPIVNAFGMNLFLTAAEEYKPELYVLPPIPAVVPPVNTIPHPKAISFLEPLNYDPEGDPDTALVYKVSFAIAGGEEKVYVLKIFRDNLSDPTSMSKQEHFLFFHSGGRHNTSHGYSRIGFERETAAYARLAYHGVTETGIVPRCYGWFTLEPSLFSFPSEVLERAEDDPQPPRAVVLEFLPDVRRISSHDADNETAKKALEALWKIHRAFIEHGDIHPRNILIRPSGEIVIVDFDSALISTGAMHSQPSRRTLMDEFGLMWTTFFNHLIPNKYIGWDAGDENF